MNFPDNGWFREHYAACMRVVIQRVLQASVTIDGVVVGEIDKGLLILLAVEESDGDEDLEWLVGKILRLRIFNDSEGQMNCAVTDVNGGILVVSQFTLYASTRKGNRPSYMRAARPEFAAPMCDRFVTVLSEELGRTVQTGRFGADMKVALINDGPVTIVIDTKARE